MNIPVLTPSYFTALAAKLEAFEHSAKARKAAYDAVRPVLAAVALSWKRRRMAATSLLLTVKA